MIGLAASAGARIPHPGSAPPVIQPLLWSSTGTVWTLSEGDTRAFRLSAINSPTGWGVVGTEFRSSGKKYFEIRVRAAPSATDIKEMNWGLVTAAFSPAARTNLWDNLTSWCVTRDGYAYHNSAPRAPTPSQPYDSTPCTLMCAVDFNLGYVWFGKNGAWPEYTAPTPSDPATGFDPSCTGIASPVTIAAVGSAQGLNDFDIDIRSEAADFTYSVPAGFTPWAEV